MDEEEYAYDFEQEQGSEEMEEYEEEYQPTEEELYEYAKCLGMDPEEDQEYLSIALEGLKAPVPEPWIACKNDEGDVFFRNNETEEISWNHPMDDFYRELFQEMKSRDIKQKKQAEKEKQMRKNAGKLQGLAPLKPSSSNNIKNERPFKEEEKINKLMNISNISSNHSKKTNNSFLAEENVNKDSLDLNSSSYKSKSQDRTPLAMGTISDRSSPLKERKLKLQKDCTNKDIDKWYKIQIEKLINSKETELTLKKQCFLDEQSQIQTELEEKLIKDIEDLTEKKEKAMKDFSSKEKNEEELKDKLNKEFQEKFVNKLEELKKGFDKKKNNYKDNLDKSNLRLIDKFKNQQNELYESKIDKIEQMKAKAKLRHDSKKNEMNESLKTQKDKISREIKQIYEKSLEKIKNETIKKNKIDKENQISKNFNEFQRKNKEIMQNNSNNFESKQKEIQEIYQRKLEFERKNIINDYDEILSDFKSAENSILTNKLNKYKSHLMESEVIFLHKQFIEEKEALKKIYKWKLDILKLPLKNNDEKEKNFTNQGFDILEQDVNEIANIVSKNERNIKKKLSSEDYFTNNVNNFRDLEIFLIEEKLDIEDETERFKKMRKIFKKQIEKFKSYEEKIFNIDIKIATVFQIKHNFGENLEKLNAIINKNKRKSGFCSKRLLMLTELSDLISNRKEEEEIREKLNFYESQKGNEQNENFEILNEDIPEFEFFEDWKNLYEKLSENINKSKSSYLQDYSAQNKFSTTNKNSLFISPNMKFS